MKNPAKIRKTYNYLISGIILLVTWGFIYRQLFTKNDIRHIWAILSGLFEKEGFRKELAFVIGLMFVNWGLESGKWKFLVSKIEKISFLKSYQAVMTGVSISSVTPNHIGEYFGRVFILEKGSHVEGILITIMGSMSQLLITILTGTFSLIILITGFIPGMQISSGYLKDTLIILIICLDILLLVLYFNISWLAALRDKILKKRFKKFRRFLIVFSYYGHRDIFKIIALSFFRYLVFSFQYYLLLRMFSVTIPYLEAMVIIAIVYLSMTVIPTIILTEVGIRGSVALYFFGNYFSALHMNVESFAIGIFAATTLIWIINLGIPAFIGTIFVFRLKFFRKNGN